MHRENKSKIFSNKSIKYNRITNTNTSNRTFILNEETNETNKIRSEYLYKVSVSQKRKKELNHRDNKYKITDEDYY